MSVDSGLSGPVEGPVAPTAPRAGTSPRVAPTRATRPGAARADALADAVSTPSFRTGRGRPRRRGRRVSRIVRRIELWSVLKIALVFNTIMLGVALGSVALLWGLANTTGLVDDLEGFLRDAGFEDFRFKGDRMFEQVAFIGAVGALAATVFMVLATALLNLISEITGGIRFVVIEEIVESPAPAPPPSRPPAPLALPTIPPVAPSYSAPTPPPVEVAEDEGPDDPPPPSSPAEPEGHDPDEGPISLAKGVLSKISAPPETRGPGTARGRSRSSSAKAKAKPRDPSGRFTASGGDGGSGSGSGRRVRRQAPKPAAVTDAADDAGTDGAGPDDATSS